MPSSIMASGLNMRVESCMLSVRVTLSEADVCGPEKLLSTTKSVSTPVMLGVMMQFREKNVPS